MYEKKLFKMMKRCVLFVLAWAGITSAAASYLKSPDNINEEAIHQQTKIKDKSHRCCT